jgi:error-prone DNA polymerase
MALSQRRARKVRRKTLERELALIGKLDSRAISSPSRTSSISRGRDPPILCQGRGSAANSAVCFCLGITAVDPAEHLAVRPLHLRGAREPPDIDVDFEHERREEVIQHIYRQAMAASARGSVRHGDPLPPAHGDPRGRQGDGPERRRHRALAGTVWGSYGGAAITRSACAEAGSTFPIRI